MTTVEARCGMSDLLVSQCGHCRNSPDPFAFEHVVERQMVAKFPGSCGACGDEIVVGKTTIGLSESGWVCEGCFR